MTLAIPLYFDPRAEAILQSAIQELADRSVAPYMLQAGIRPHITLAIYRDIDSSACQRALTPLIDRLQPLQLQFAHIGIFSEPDPVVFLAPIVTPRLLELHRQVNHLLDPLGDKPVSYYQPGQWVPHCTLAVEFDPDRISAAVKIASRVRLPLLAWAAQLCLVEYPSLNHLFSLDLKSAA